MVVTFRLKRLQKTPIINSPMHDPSYFKVLSMFWLTSTFLIDWLIEWFNLNKYSHQWHNNTHIKWWYRLKQNSHCLDKYNAVVIQCVVFSTFWYPNSQRIDLFLLIQDLLTHTLNSIDLLWHDPLVTGRPHHPFVSSPQVASITAGFCPSVDMETTILCHTWRLALCSKLA